VGLKESRVSLFIQYILVANVFVTHWGGRDPGASKPFFGKGMAKVMTTFMVKVMAKGVPKLWQRLRQSSGENKRTIRLFSKVNGLIHYFINSSLDQFIN